MLPRAYWKGHLKLSLMQCAVGVYAANGDTDRITFRTVSKETGNRLQQQMVDSVTGEVVENEDKGKGFEIAKDQYVVLEEEDFDSIKLESSDVMEIERFTAKNAIDPAWLGSSFYVAPDDRVSDEVFTIIREVMADRKVVAIARAVMHRRERVLRLQPYGRGILATQIRYPYEVRAADPVFDHVADLRVPDEMLELAGQIVDRRIGPFEPEKYEDRYEAALLELIKAKQAGREAEVPNPERRSAKVVSIMDALRRSVEHEKKAGRAVAKAGKAKRKKAGGKK